VKELVKEAGAKVKMSKPAGRNGDYVRLLVRDKAIAYAIARKEHVRLDKLALDVKSAPAAIRKGVSGPKPGLVTVVEQNVKAVGKFLGWVADQQAQEQPAKTTPTRSRARGRGGVQNASELVTAGQDTEAS
jgi:hypothetical protein